MAYFQENRAETLELKVKISSSKIAKRSKIYFKVAFFKEIRSCKDKSIKEWEKTASMNLRLII